MAIVQTIDNAYQLEQAFVACGRGSTFTADGIDVLYKHLDTFSDKIGENIVLDVVALCCEYSEDSIDDLISNYNIEIDLDACIDAQDQDEVEEIKRETVREYLEENTAVCGGTSDGFVYAAF